MEKTLIVLVFAIILTAKAELESYNYEARYNGDNIVMEDVKIDREQQYAIISVTPISGDVTATINYHDFRTHFLAVKDEKRETCYIFRAGQTLEEMIESFETSAKKNGFLDISRSYRCTSRTIIDNEELSEMYGERIAKFCSDNLVIQSGKRLMNKWKREIKFISGRSMGCGVCVFSNC